MDCWPQFSDAVVDYYFDKKLAYYYIKNSQQPLRLMMDKKKGLTLYAVSDLDEDKKIRYTVTVNGKKIKEGEGTAKAEQSVVLCKMKGRGRKFFVIEWKDEEGREGRNHFLLGRPFFAYRWYKKQMDKSGLMGWRTEKTSEGKNE